MAGQAWAAVAEQKLHILAAAMPHIDAIEALRAQQHGTVRVLSLQDVVNRQRELDHAVQIVTEAVAQWRKNHQQQISEACADLGHLVQGTTVCVCCKADLCK